MITRYSLNVTVEAKNFLSSLKKLNRKIKPSPDVTFVLEWADCERGGGKLVFPSIRKTLEHYMKEEKEEKKIGKKGGKDVNL